MTGQHQRTTSPVTFRRRRLVVLALLVTLLAATATGSRWVMTADGVRSTAPAQGGLAAAARGSLTNPSASAQSRPPAAAKPGGPLTITASGPGHLAPGSDPSVLPGPILIADEKNNRLLIIDPHGRSLWQFPRPGDLAAGQTFTIPDDAFFTPNGKQIVATEEDDQVVRVIDVATHMIVYTYGTPGVPGSGPNHLNNPDDAVMLPAGDIVVPDIKNCRIIMIPMGGHAISRQLGRTGTCVHRPPQTFGSPNGVFPMSNGNYLVTEINGSWVSEMNLSGRLAWSAHLQSVAYPSDANQIGPDRYLTVDYSRPGQILTFDHTGQVLWRYAPTGGQALNKPSLALPLPNGDVLANDDANNRVIVVDPRTNRVVWQYGHTHVAGSSAGFLNNPDGLDLYPPSSELVTRAATMGAVPQS
ncbi:MAG: PQQ-binding-like beta-propeller repeat protein [Phycicoccus sp.]|nr:PQQ-binding-like beta-propeller repeat protein [Phycicoccus sp.]NMM32649.1 PQQ-binding-like beta-propeller repeat protein [Phycicoccus sp.]